MKAVMVRGLFDELEKISGVGSLLVDAALKDAILHPVKYQVASARHKEGVLRHQQMMQAVRNPSPAGWVPLGIRPG